MLSVPDRVRIAADISHRAQFFFAAWFEIASAEGRQRYSLALDEHAQALIMTQAAHMVALVSALHSLFERREDTANLPALSSGLGIAAPLIEEAKGTIKKVIILRHNLYAHRNGSLTQAEIYRLARITPNELRWLAVRSAAVIREFCDHLSLPVAPDVDEAAPLMRRMLEALTRGSCLEAK